ncbi:MAG: hypothetical protein KC910_14800 [Candidatus Eremiobacteraeota bacterium]|nr:hypothetical protein [Candidatus Eremiobacteraeota bacterium]
MRLWAVVFLLLAVPAVAKPMAAPTLEEGLNRSIPVVGEFVDYEQGEIDYFGGTVARYRVLHRPSGRGPAVGTIIKVRYLFQDGSACLPERGWKFSPAMMPAPKSRWILLLEGEQEPWNTYRGNFGRLPATAENLARVATH